MNRLSDIGTIKDILSRHGFTFSKSLGQNFLINPSVCPRMAELSGAGKGVGVIEIGPGIGVLTNELCKLADKVVAIELDKRLLPVLEETLGEYDNLKVINADVLETDLHKLIEDEFSGMEVVVCANLPYYITSPVIMKLLEDKLPISAITVMVQKEAAQRICAEVGSRQSGAVTVSVNYYAKPEMLFSVSAGSFMPAPKVDSAVIRLNVLDKPPVMVNDEKKFFSVVKASFSQRRKVISNSLSSGLSLDKSKTAEILEKSDVPLNARAEKLSLQNFADIANNL
ncbi:16S rRNA (adenine(1518)-N(6)/adenine(1519)-N(6))-dimethyltransferase RsmA [Ruminococcus sp.]|jgi:16S rRNA (adenine1518-N6/adenine1519-N6)-dimethyltransferase|uniref:16S rRNA (adenine(1518)-N(6)/adenine(1519)-N(6))- dimethyltransferase RsmA n=1 Tax=Ruminococcus sp. TaxID=41978 RepID=UPI002608ACD4|nr:16S rRNA (adenine(1518)-N(6)/adenine(1519)-N(6))-dimethyltransferase RsmA [Ruminococcus sp.]MCI2112119.1 16S rRNA (adenine(1518)-N(6)/adenine(1519)-N(6))-dimethyltransferase RsmA [Ruminococcus sp.]MDD6988671.1 16S rRNA (adenine(1518)-N(6)/adenine(1519)-N(6))-dimethyltransferase RsmA [Ruminococcus sp.]MDY6201696.1 16S rRNA (adenine(1518)-N(6)/adenine(1519)-N(6))-dimethyltransferase RsmA [Ruminococcus sp.]